jgi:transposase
MPIYIGIDWSQKKHDVAFVNEKGGIIETFVIEHSVAGFAQLEAKREQLQVQAGECIVGMETAHSLLIDHLWLHGYETIYVLPPGVINANRGRTRQSGARNDRYDSLVVAETLRTDRHKFTCWHPGSSTLQQLRVMVGQGFFWTQESLRLANRLQTLLGRYYPVALAVFPSWPTRLSCDFILAYPTAEAASALTWPQFEAFAKAHHYPRPKQLPAAFQRLQQSYPPVRPALVVSYAQEARTLASLLRTSLEIKAENLKQLHKLFETHPDAHIFASLPGVGAWLAPALLVKVGEDRQRFPTAASLQALAGTCPVTSQSGTRASVYFRRSCDHQFRQIAQQWARAAVKDSDWANSYYQDVLTRSGKPNHAYRCLANRLTAILWKLWQSNTDYDEAVHLHNRMRRCQPRPHTKS